MERREVIILLTYFLQALNFYSYSCIKDLRTGIAYSLVKST